VLKDPGVRTRKGLKSLRHKTAPNKEKTSGCAIKKGRQILASDNQNSVNQVPINGRVGRDKGPNDRKQILNAEKARGPLIRARRY